MSAACATSLVQPTKDGLVEYAGSQKTIFDTGKAEQTVSVATMAACADSFSVGAVAGLDGEITVYQGKPYVTKVRGDGYTVDRGHEHGAVFAAVSGVSWTAVGDTPAVGGHGSCVAPVGYRPGNNHRDHHRVTTAAEQFLQQLLFDV